MKDDQGLAYVGRIINLELIEGADFILLATVVCGLGGKWRGVVRKSEHEIGQLVTVYLPDALLPPNPTMQFMEKHKWRVRMHRYKGAPSEVLIVPLNVCCDIGMDATELLGVTKYHKPIPAHMTGIAKGDFPQFIPKTDELYYQSHPELVDCLTGAPYYITLKYDGSSSTAYRYKGQFGVCSRNYEIEEDEKNGYWEIAHRYNLREKLPEGFALQWETCGPKIQGNRMKLDKIEGFAFNVYDIEQKRYLEVLEFSLFCDQIGFPKVELVQSAQVFNPDWIPMFEDGIATVSGLQCEGVVIRSRYNIGHKPISFKVINLNYEK